MRNLYRKRTPRTRWGPSKSSASVCERRKGKQKTNLEGWQRTKADFVNLKRDEETRRQYARSASSKASIAEDMIPVLDSFEMSAKHSDNKDLQALHKQLLGSIKNMGIERFGQVGELFDPHKHEALREVAVDSPEDEHKIVSVERSGYSIGTHVIRPAQVSVGTFDKNLTS